MLTHDQVNASPIKKIISWFKFLGKNLHLVGCATVCAKSEVMLLKGYNIKTLLVLVGIKMKIVLDFKNYRSLLAFEEELRKSKSKIAKSFFAKGPFINDVTTFFLVGALCTIAEGFLQRQKVIVIYHVKN